jgi:hypothetical protein
MYQFAEVVASISFSLAVLACIKPDNTGSSYAAVIGVCRLGINLLSCHVASLKASTG